MLPVDFVGIPGVRKAIEDHFDHFDLRASDVRHTFVSKFDVRIGNRSHRISFVTVPL
jgi:hypothetical protein